SDLPRLLPSVELVLFRALQESLTNVHRYSASSRVDIQVQLDAEKISLQVRDYGRGIPADVIQMFQEKGTGVGVGLAHACAPERSRGNAGHFIRCPWHDGSRRDTHSHRQANACPFGERRLKVCLDNWNRVTQAAETRRSSFH